MDIGEVFSIEGYDVVATARYASCFGEVLVLNNNSTHFLVCVRPGDADDNAELEGSFDYGRLEENDATAAACYRQALAMMVAIAGKR